MKALYTLAAIFLALLVATPLTGVAGTGDFSMDARHMALIANANRHGAFARLDDPRHMALIANARRHGVSVRFDKSIAARQLFVGSNGNGASRARIHPHESGALPWARPGVLAGLSLALACVIGRVVVAARRRSANPHAVRA